MPFPDPELLERIDAIPRLGLLKGPSPLESQPELAAELGASELWVKRDDLIETWGGGTKIRKLDYLLASPRLREAARWVTFGAIGSGHLVAVTHAAQALSKGLDIHMFLEPVSDGVLENLAFTVSGPTQIHYTKSRVGIGLKHPFVLLADSWRGHPVIPPGASTAVASMGVARGAVELLGQLAERKLQPTRLVAPLGSGGTIAGLWVGLAISKAPIALHAVATVERIFAPLSKLRALAEATARELEAHGLPKADLSTIRVTIERRELGSGYGVPTTASAKAAERMRQRGFAGEPVYSGKAFAALEHGGLGGERIVFWVTPRKWGALPALVDWKDKLPPALHRDLFGQASRAGRRWFLVGVAGILAGVTAKRLTGGDFAGQILSGREAEVLTHAAEVMVPTGPIEVVAKNVDRFLVGQPPRLVMEIRALLHMVEQAPPLGGWTRFSQRSLEDRRERLDRMGKATGPMGLLYRGLRDLVMLGVYQDPSTWKALSYPGPWVDDRPRPDPYAALRGTEPKSWRQV